MTRIRVTKLLNTRIGGPDRTFKKGRVRLPLEEIEVEDAVVNGEVIAQNGMWYKREDEFFWSGGADLIVPLAIEVTRAQAEAILSTPPAVTGAQNVHSYLAQRFVNGQLTSPIDYNLLLNIPTDIKATKGKGVKVAIMDASIHQTITFTNAVTRPLNSPKPPHSHGSFVAGIIAGINNILGIAPECELIELPIFLENGHRHEPMIRECIRFLEGSDDLVVVNISQSLPSELAPLFSNLRNKIIVAAAGQGEQLKSHSFFPANLPNVIGVGVINKSMQPTIAASSLNSELDFIFGDFNYVSYKAGDTQFRSLTGESFACAVTSALVALLISSGKIGKETSLAQIKSEILNFSAPYSSQLSFDFLNTINTKL